MQLTASVGASRLMSMGTRAERSLRADYDAYSPPQEDEQAPPHSHRRRRR